MMQGRQLKLKYFFARPANFTVSMAEALYFLKKYYFDVEKLHSVSFSIFWSNVLIYFAGKNVWISEQCAKR